MHQVRALFPYLARHEQWAAIADCSFRRAALCGYFAHPARREANLKAGRPDAAAGLLRAAVAQWPDNPLELPYLSDLAARQPGSRWEDHFSRNLAANFLTLDADALSLYIDHWLPARPARPRLAPLPSAAAA